ncbi:MAG: hypothetical protein ACK4I8_05260, partial [Armatimonadota bacterium]
MMQRDTALILFGVGLIVLLLLVGVALHISSPPQPVSEPQEKVSTVISSTTPTFPPTQTASPISPPALVTPSLPPPATQTSFPQTAAISTVEPFPRKGTIPSPTVAPTPPTPSLQFPTPSSLPRARPAPAEAPVENEALLWAKALVANYRPQWRLNLTKSIAPNLKGESYAVTVEPDNQVIVEARTTVGWLYGLLDLAERLQWREPINAQWIWSPPLTERGLVMDNPEWLIKPPRSLEAMRSVIRDCLKELAWWRFNTLVLKCNGREPALKTALEILRQLSPNYGVKVVVWAQEITPTVQAWVQTGGRIAATNPVGQDNEICISFDLGEAVQNLRQGRVTVFASQLVAPNVPPKVFQFGRSREKLLMLIGLDKAYERVFWFDPAWAHQLIRSIKDAGLNGLWLSVRSVPSKWAIAAFAQAIKNPESDGESLWLSRWAKQGQQADKWISLFRESSRVIPEILWLGVSAEPQYGASLKAFFTARPIDSSWGFTVLSVTEILTSERSVINKTTLTVDEIARRLEQRAQTIWTLTAQLPEPSAPDWKVAKRLALLNSWLGQFYANKIDAAIAW